MLDILNLLLHTTLKCFIMPCILFSAQHCLYDLTINFSLSHGNVYVEPQNTQDTYTLFRNIKCLVFLP